MGKGGKSKGAPPPPAPCSYPEGSGRQGWREKAAQVLAAEAAAAEENKPWRNLKVKALPSGPLDDPQWKTAFDAEIPDEGTTRAVIFIATLAGSYCIKASLQPAEEYFATKFMQHCGCQIPMFRVIFKHHPEYVALFDALRRLAELAGSRRDEEKKQRITMVSNKGLNKHQLFLMKVVPNPESLSRQVAENLLALPGGECPSHSTPAALRLQALGRVWFAHALLGFRDCISLHPLLDFADDTQGLHAVKHSHLRRLVAGITANPDNLLFTADVPSSQAGLFTIDNHVKHIAGTAQYIDREAQASRWGEFITSLCEEQRDAGAKQSSLEFLRDFVLSVTGGQEGDAQLYKRFMESIQPQERELCTLGIWPPSEHPDYYNMLVEKLRPSAAMRVLDGNGHDITSSAVKNGRFVSRLLHSNYPIRIVDSLPEAPAGIVGLCKELASEGDSMGADIGYRLSDSELGQVRVGILGLIRDISFAGVPANLSSEMPESDCTFARWLDAEMLDLEKPDWFACDIWKTSVRRIDFTALKWYVDVVRTAALEHSVTLSSLPPADPCIAQEQQQTSCAPHDAAVDIDANSVGADKALWRALPEEVRRLLRKELERASS